MVDFRYYINRAGAKGEKGDKGDKGDPGNTPIPSTGTNTPTEYTIVWDLGDGNTWETGNLKQPTVDQGGTTLRYDRANDRIVLGEPDLASTANMTPGIVYLADDERIENEDVQDDDAVTYKVFKDKTDDLQEQITEVGDDLDDLADVVDRNSDDIESLDGRLDDEEANMLIVQGDITTLNDTKASKTELSSGLATKANVVHNHTMSQITDAGSLANKNNVDYQTEVTNKPTISNNTITIKQGTTIKGTFTLNQTNDGLITLDDPTGVIPGPGLDLDTSTNTLSVKLDNNTLKLNGSGQLYADIPAANDATITITQGGVTKGTFTTNQSVNGTIALDAGPDMSAYYTKSQTDSLLDEKIDNDVVQYPLQYLPDTTNVINSLNDTNLTINRVNGDNNGEYSSSNTIRFYDSTDLSITDFTTDPKGLINKTTLGWIEYEFGDNFNLVLTGGLVDNSGYSRFSFMYPAFFGYYENDEFIPVIVLSLDQPGYSNYARLKTIVNNTIVQNITTANQDYVAGDMAIQFQSGVLKFRCVSSYGFFYNSRTTVTLSQAESEEIAKCTHVRVVPITKGSYTNNAYLSPYNAYYNEYYEIYNPSIDVINTKYPKNGQTSIFANIHPASLSLKYDSNTLGVNTNNELYAISSTPSNMVTTDTNQTITGTKTFNSNYTYFNTDKMLRVGSDGASQHIDMIADSYNSVPRLSIYNSNSGSKYGLELSNQMYNSKYRFWLRQPNASTDYYDSKIYKSNSGNDSFSSSDLNNFLLEKSMIDGTTITYNSSTGKISASANPPIATSSSTGIVQPDNSTITVDGNGVISAVNNSIAKTAPVIPLKYEEQEDGVSTGIGGVLNHTTYTDSADKVYVADASTTGIYNMSGDGYIYQSAANMMSKIFYRGYKIRLDNGLNIAWNIAEGSGFFMNVAVGYYNNGTFVPVLYALNTDSYGGSMFARPALEIASDVYDMGRLNTQFTSCVGISLLGNVLSAFSPSNGRHTYTISDTTLLTELQKCTHAICTVINESSTGTTFNYSTGKFANPATTLSDDSEARNTIFSAAENLILNDDVTVIPELKLNYDSNALGVNASNELTVPTATTSNKGLVQPDGTTITINNGVISAAGGSTPSNMVTTDTTQNITGVKSFTNNYSAALIAQAEYGIMVSTNMSDHYSGYGVNLNKYGVNIRGQNNLGQITISSNSTLGQTAYLFTIKQASNKTKFIHDDYLSDKKIYRDNNATNFLLEKDMLDGTYLKWDSTNNKITVDIQAIKDAIDALSNSSGSASTGGV